MKLTMSQTKDAKAWLDDCFGGDPDARRSIRMLGPKTIASKIERLYDGGVAQFLADA